MAINQAMVKVMKRSGMVDDGVRKKHYLFNGEEVDLIHMAMHSEKES